MLILIHYGELALKGRNRRLYELKLKENIERVLGTRVKALEGRIVAYGGEPDVLSLIPGIEWFAEAETVSKDIDSICSAVLELIKPKVVERKPSFGVFVKRADKSFPQTSIEVARIVGSAVQKEYGLTVNLSAPELPIYIEIARQCYIHLEKRRGASGLPVGVTGDVLCLLSGGIDSAVASYLMMKRGCRVDFLHFHTFSANEEVLGTKVSSIVETLDRYQYDSRLFLVPYYPFEFAVSSRLALRGYELVLFRRFMARVADKVARRYAYKAIVTGDCLAQVASQTLENLYCFSDASTLLVLQPLISFGKSEIVNIAKKIGTYEKSIEPYKDCCSMVMRGAKIRASVETARLLETELGMEGVVEAALDEASSFDIEGIRKARSQKP